MVRLHYLTIYCCNNWPGSHIKTLVKNLHDFLPARQSLVPSTGNAITALIASGTSKLICKKPIYEALAENLLAMMLDEKSRGKSVESN